MSCSGAFAQTELKETAASTEEDALTKLEKSPWLLLPTFQSNPKLGTSLGVLAGYVHYFDEKSRPSIFAVLGQYTSTESIVAGVQARTSWDEDQQRVIAGMVYGYIKNDYSDYLGTGVPLQSNSEVKGMIGRYTYRVHGNWFLGAQGLYQNFGIGGETAFDDMVLDVLGVAPYKSGGLGLVAQYDSRDNENSPAQGWLATLNNMAYRESLGGENDFDVIRADFRYYMPHGKGNVLAPTDADRERIAKMWLKACEIVDDCCGKMLDQSLSDLEFLQRVIDDDYLERSQTWELQSLGIALGRVLANNVPGLDWAIIEDEYGRDPTIQYRETSLVFNVQTMISKRIEDGEDVNVRALYDFVLRVVEEKGGSVDRAAT